MDVTVYSSAEFEGQFTYPENDLGAFPGRSGTAFRIWAPTAAHVKLNLYKSGAAGAEDRFEQLEMQPDVNGTWVAKHPENLSGVYYTYLVDIDGQWCEACDPYAKATGVNGKRGMVIDLKTTDPEGWEDDKDPNSGIAPTDAVIYELHLRDVSAEPSSGIRSVGKFLTLTESGTATPTGDPTGLAHIKSLGVTHLHLLPLYDYGSVDEAKPDQPQYNWGYDPVNYNVPEGSYATDPYDGAVRVKEMKRMVKALHDNGISVVMDVVYNHVFDADSFCFNKIVPGYFSRLKADGSYSNGSGCGNDTASERSMVRKYIVDSVMYWAQEYHIDGFRFDLVGLLDVETVNAIVRQLRCVKPDILLYGEGWTLSTAASKPNCLMATQTNAALTPGFAYFSDTVRDMLRGSVFDDAAPGYISGAAVPKELVHQCFMGMPQWCPSPRQSVNYASCHDNMTLFDRLFTTAPDADLSQKVKMNLLAAVFYMTAQGIPFIHAGEELLRTKRDAAGKIVENSYRSPDAVNAIKWQCLDDTACQSVREYYKGLIAFRKAHRLLRLQTRQEVLACVHPVAWQEPKAAAFLLEDETERIFVVFNPEKHWVDITLPEGEWQRHIDATHAGTQVIAVCSGKISVEAISAAVFVQSK